MVKDYDTGARESGVPVSENPMAVSRAVATFSLCHTTARIPDGWQRAYDQWMSTAKNPESIEYILSTDDHTKIDRPITQHVVNTGRRSSTDGWNVAAAASRGKLIVSIADDYFPDFEHWDEAILKEIPDLDGEYVLQVDNMDRAYPLMAFCFMTRPYYERYGYMFYPEYQGMMADWDFTSVAYRDGVVLDRRNLKFRHLNPEVGTAEWDNIYRWQRRESVLKEGQEIYDRRKKAGVFKTTDGRSLII